MVRAEDAAVSSSPHTYIHTHAYRVIQVSQQTDIRWRHLRIVLEARAFTYLGRDDDDDAQRRRHCRLGLWCFYIHTHVHTYTHTHTSSDDAPPSHTSHHTIFPAYLLTYLPTYFLDLKRYTSGKQQNWPPPSMGKGKSATAESAVTTVGELGKVVLGDVRTTCW